MPDIIVMFFVLGLFAGSIGSDLKVPKAAYNVLSILLMLTIGLKGGMALHGNVEWRLIGELLGVAALGFLIPLVLYPLLRSLVRLNTANAASFAAHYGSVSAGTFAVSLAWVESRNMMTGGEVTLYLVLLELPAILMGLFLYQRLSNRDVAPGTKLHLLREPLTNRSVILLAGGVVIGALYGPDMGTGVTAPLTEAFSVVLALFLLEMGLVASETLKKLTRKHWRVVAFAAIAPALLAIPGLAAALLMDLDPGNAVILGTLTASASYIAAPVTIRHAIPEADIGMAMLASLGVTFPFNVLVGIGLYHQMYLVFQ